MHSSLKKQRMQDFFKSLAPNDKIHHSWIDTSKDLDGVDMLSLLKPSEYFEGKKKFQPFIQELLMNQESFELGDLKIDGSFNLFYLQNSFWRKNPVQIFGIHRNMINNSWVSFHVENPTRETFKVREGTRLFKQR